MTNLVLKDFWKSLKTCLPTDFTAKCVSIKISIRETTCEFQLKVTKNGKWQEKSWFLKWSRTNTVKD